MEQGHTYHLQALGGSPAIHGATIYADKQGSIVITKPTNAQEYQKCLLTLGKEDGTIVTPNTSLNNTSPDLYYTLQGPSGKGDHRLAQAPKPKARPGAIGQSVFFNGWEVKDYAGLLFLRHKAVAFSGFWIAVPDEDEEGIWYPWWYSPSAANLEDFKSYVMIDIELVRADTEA